MTYFIIKMNFSINLFDYISVKITLFYIIYYTFLTAFFIVMLQVFFKTLREDRPTWTMEDGGLIGNQSLLESKITQYIYGIFVFLVFMEAIKWGFLSKFLP